MKQITKRILSGEDLKKSILQLIEDEDIRAGIVGSVVGSLEAANLRMAGGKDVKSWSGPLEVVSANGTLSKDGIHVHVSISDKFGNVFGGHLEEGCVVRTTIELVLIVFDDAEYRRKLDPATGYKELDL